MKRARLVATHTVVVEEALAPNAGSGEALVRVEAVGICGSDVHAYHNNHPFISLPVVPGHEFAGRVVAVGAPELDDWVGKRVTAVPSLVCGKCYNCRHGRYNICNELRVIGCQADGAMAELVRVPAEMLVELPETMTMETGALVEPLAVAVGAVHRAGSVAGRRVVVFGCGTIGLFVLQVTKAYGAQEVIAVDPCAGRRKLAQQLGADVALDPTVVDPVAWALTQYGPDGIDLSFECVGIAVTLNTAIRMNRKGTRVVVVGVYSGAASIDIGLVQDREIELVGTLMYRKEDFVEASRLIHSGCVQGAPLVSHHFALEEAAEAFKLAASGGQEAVKVLLRV